MTMCDTLLLIHTAILSLILSSNTDRVVHCQQFFESMLLLPFAIFAVVLFMKLTFKLKAICMSCLQRTFAGRGPDGSGQQLIQGHMERELSTDYVRVVMLAIQQH